MKNSLLLLSVLSGTAWCGYSLANKVKMQCRFDVAETQLLRQAISDMEAEGGIIADCD